MKKPEKENANDYGGGEEVPEVPIGGTSHKGPARDKRIVGTPWHGFQQPKKK